MLRLMMTPSDCQDNSHPPVSARQDATQTPAHTWARQFQQLAAQQWPLATLYVVATPIGNLADMSARAAYTLHLVDTIAAEDTRTSKALLQAWGINTPLMAAHRHNEASAAEAVIACLAEGKRVALISDAGAPAISDPGARIVHAVRAAGYRVIPIPGPSAVITALMASGATSDENPAFCFAGFPPPKKTARKKWLQQWCSGTAPVVMYESPHRLPATLDDLLAVCGPERRVTIARELTKRFEEICTVRLGDATRWLNEHARRAQGEFVLIVEGAPQLGSGFDRDIDTMLLVLLEMLSTKDASRVAAKLTGVPRDQLYERAIQLRDSSPSTS